jgi:hypothetical protein
MLKKRKTIHYLIAMYVKMLTIMVPIIPIAAPIIMPFWKQGLLKSLKNPMKPNACSSLLLLFELFALFCRAIYEKSFYYFITILVAVLFVAVFIVAVVIVVVVDVVVYCPC